MRYSISVLFGFVFAGVFAQPNLPENGVVFTSEEIPKVHITIDEDSLNTLYLEENWYSNHEYPALFVFETEEQIDTIPLVGLRFRGNTARDKIKKSFKISINSFVSGQKYYGLEKLNLNAETNDPAMMRSRLCWDLYRRMGVPAPRSNHVELYINGDYYGLYLNTEHIDEEFCDLRFGSQGGNLYKCSYPANLDYISNNPDDYKLAPWGERTYELKTNKEEDDYSDLAELISILNLSSDGELACNLPVYLNVYSYLKVAAIDVLTGNWDGYIYNQNNYYLYHNPTNDQFEYIPYDTDNTWGIDWLDRDWSDRNIYTWSQTGAERPLFNRLMGIEVYRDAFTRYVDEILSDHFYTDEHQERIQNLQEFIQASALADPYRPLDWGFSNEDFLNALEESAGGHVDFGIFSFAQIRKESALNQLENTSMPPIPSLVKEDFEGFPENFELIVHLEGPECNQANFIYAIDGVQQVSLSYDSPDSLLEISLNLPADLDELTYNVSLNSVDGESRNLFCTDRVVKYGNTEELYLNEVMSANDQSIADEAGEFDDWVELFNGGSEPIDLGSYFLSDNSSSPVKWRFPSVTILPGEFKLIWCDRDLHQGPLHSNFRLDAEGEEIFLFAEEENGLRLMDGTDIPPLPGDYSFGRESDGSLPWILFWAPTPGASNSGLLNVAENTDENFRVYPNPVSSVLNLDRVGNYTILDIHGRPVLSGRGASVDVSHLALGVYYIKCGSLVEKFVKS